MSAPPLATLLHANRTIVATVPPSQEPVVKPAAAAVGGSGRTVFRSALAPLPASVCSSQQPIGTSTSRASQPTVLHSYVPPDAPRRTPFNSSVNPFASKVQGPLVNEQACPQQQANPAPPGNGSLPLGQPLPPSSALLQQVIVESECTARHEITEAEATIAAVLCEEASLRSSLVTEVATKMRRVERSASPRGASADAAPRLSSPRCALRHTLWIKALERVVRKHPNYGSALIPSLFSDRSSVLLCYAVIDFAVSKLVDVDAPRSPDAILDLLQLLVDTGAVMRPFEFDLLVSSRLANGPQNPTLSRPRSGQCLATLPPPPVGVAWNNVGALANAWRGVSDGHHVLSSETLLRLQELQCGVWELFFRALCRVDVHKYDLQWSQWLTALMRTAVTPRACRRSFLCTATRCGRVSLRKPGLGSWTCATTSLRICRKYAKKWWRASLMRCATL